MDTRDKVFDLLVELSDYTHEDGLVLVSRKLEEALDAFLAETGHMTGADAGADMAHRTKRVRTRSIPVKSTGGAVRATVR